MIDQAGSAVRVGVYVDAFNVYYGGREMLGPATPGWKWLDIAALAAGLINPWVWPGARIDRVVYCTAMREREGDPSSLADQHTYLAALRHANPSLTVALGKYVPRTKSGVLVEQGTGYPPRRVRSPGTGRLPAWLPVREVPGPSGATDLLARISTFEEKGSDVNVASHVLMDVLTGQVDAVMVLSNDSDLSFPLRQTRLRVPVATVNPSVKPTTAALRGDRDEGVGRHWWRRLRRQDFLANQLADPTGPFRKPPGW
ncbi:NYN domain-containing protein [Crossiella sp. SN42]|uniref:NYN domain-containing protein n=1 Tax=Crossiella sp. SN42 TaxID=2944808 RepID=UPI00207D2BAF|nr:NYN domain-containing protein [Crossiella sp. SN42]MCO1574908.1 NYN domain-containing protein [Crossiella sp. SN42]